MESRRTNGWLSSSRAINSLGNRERDVRRPNASRFLYVLWKHSLGAHPSILLLFRFSASNRADHTEPLSMMPKATREHPPKRDMVPDWPFSRANFPSFKTCIHSGSRQRAALWSVCSMARREEKGKLWRLKALSLLFWGSRDRSIPARPPDSPPGRARYLQSQWPLQFSQRQLREWQT